VQGLLDGQILWDEQSSQRAKRSVSSTNQTVMANLAYCREYDDYLCTAGDHIEAFIAAIDCMGSRDSYRIQFTMRDVSWSMTDYGDRLSFAKLLWHGCVKFSQTTMPSKCHLMLVDQEDRDLGGSSESDGSVIAVKRGDYHTAPGALNGAGRAAPFGDRRTRRRGSAV
jgi:hypothetical protein